MSKLLDRRPTVIVGILACLALQHVVDARPVAQAQTSRSRAETPQVFFASPSGSPEGDGSKDSPWDLQTALDHPPAARPGDTIWLRGGTYSPGPFVSRLTGTPGAYVTLRQYPGERAILDGAAGAPQHATLIVSGAWATFWGFEITNSNPTRPNVPFSRPNGVFANAPHTRFINLIVHDTGQGFGFWTPAPDSEISGSLIYYNGNHELDHGIYAQNQNGTKKIFNNILFNNYGHGIHAYGSGAFLNGFDIEGNTSYNNGRLSSGDPARNLLLGGGNVAKDPIIRSNFLYDVIPADTVSSFKLSNCENPVVTDNYVANSTLLLNCSNITMTGNTYYGGATGFHQSRYPDNTYLSSQPTGVRIFIRPNAYEAGRANITVYNWDLRSTVDVDLSGVLTAGSSYEIRNAADYFGAPVASGTYSGGAVALPMNGLSVAVPVGFLPPPPSGPAFNAFVLITTRFARAQPILPARTTNPTPRSARVPIQKKTPS